MIVVFENLSILYLPFLIFYLVLGYDIRYINISGNSYWRSICLKLDRRGFIKTVHWKDSNLDKLFLSHDLAYDNFEEIWARTFEESRLLRNFELLLGSDDIQLAHKKYLIEKLQIYYGTLLRLNHWLECSKYSSVVFIPLDYIEMEGWKINTQSPKLNLKITVPLWAKIYGKSVIFLHKQLYALIPLLLPLWYLLKVRRINFKKKSLQKYQIGFRVYDNDVRFRNSTQTVDFLVDGKKIKSENIVFCNEQDIAPDYKAEFEKRGYNIIPLQNVLAEINLSFFWDVLIKKYFINCIKSFFFSFGAKRDMVFVNTILLFYYPLWAGFLEKYRFNNYVVYNNISFTHVLRNSMFSQLGIKTWFYAHSNHQMDLFRPPDKKMNLFPSVFCYLYYDNFVSWGDKLTSFFKNDRTNIANFHNLGILWSESVRQLIESRESEAIRERAHNAMKGRPEKIIGVFDTSFGKDLLSKEEDIMKFLEDLIRLLDEMPYLGIILKEKNPWKEVLESPEVALSYKRLRRHERCYGSRNPNNPDAQEVIAASDLVISACFTSPTTIAFGARKKGIYYDPTSCFKGYYYDRIPKLVAKGYDELKFLVNYWLYEINDKEFEDYIDTYIKEEIDAYADGKSISRFREMLISRG